MAEAECHAMNPIRRNLTIAYLAVSIGTLVIIYVLLEMHACSPL
jgi:hypothetical protein